MVMRMDFDNANVRADLARDGSFVTTGELRTAVILSLFSDARARDEDGVDKSLRRGWWGDTYPTVAGDQWGSRLWTLRRRGATRRALELARKYAAEALQWMIDDGVASQIDIEAELHRPSTLALAVRIRRPGTQVHQWEDVWEGEMDLGV